MNGLFAFGCWLLTAIILLYLSSKYIRKNRTFQFVAIAILLLVAMVLIQTLTTHFADERLSPTASHSMINETNSDILKLPSDQLYQSEGVYFRSFVHYNDDWQHMTNTNWTVPEHINTKFYGTKKKFGHWDYDIIDFPIIPNFLQSTKSRVISDCFLISFSL